jgi:hypothetical protein
MRQRAVLTLSDVGQVYGRGSWLCRNTTGERSRRHPVTALRQNRPPRRLSRSDCHRGRGAGPVSMRAAYGGPSSAVTWAWYASFSARCTGRPSRVGSGRPGARSVRGGCCTPSASSRPACVASRVWNSVDSRSSVFGAAYRLGGGAEPGKDQVVHDGGTGAGRLAVLRRGHERRAECGDGTGVTASRGGHDPRGRCRRLRPSLTGAAGSDDPARLRSRGVRALMPALRSGRVRFGAR